MISWEFDPLIQHHTYTVMARKKEYVNYSSLSEAAEVRRDLCEEAIENGTIYRHLTELKTR